MTQLQVVRSLKADEVDLWLKFLADAFASKGSNMLELFRENVKADLQFDVSDVLLLEKDGAWVSTVHVARKEIWLNGSRVKMAGIANVATSPIHLRRGYAEKVMSYTPQHAVQIQGAWLAGLHCSRSDLWPFYQKCGYTHIPLQEDSVTITFPSELDACTICSCGFTESELHQMTMLHQSYFSHYTGPLCRDTNKCCWNTTYTKRGVNFGYIYDSNASALQGDSRRIAAYIGIRKLNNQDNSRLTIEIVEYAGSHDAGCHENQLFMPLLCHMIQRMCHCQPGDQVNITYPSLMCNKAWFGCIVSSEFQTKLQYGFMYRYTDDQHKTNDITKLLNKFVFLYIDRF